MTLSGNINDKGIAYYIRVLIPLLVDDPLWALRVLMASMCRSVLIPLLVDDPLWECVS